MATGMISSSAPWTVNTGTRNFINFPQVVIGHLGAPVEQEGGEHLGHVRGVGEVPIPGSGPGRAFDGVVRSERFPGRPARIILLGRHLGLNAHQR